MMLISSLSPNLNTRPNNTNSHFTIVGPCPVPHPNTCSTSESKQVHPGPENSILEPSSCTRRFLAKAKVCSACLSVCEASMADLISITYAQTWWWCKDIQKRLHNFAGYCFLTFTSQCSGVSGSVLQQYLVENWIWWPVLAESEDGECGECGKASEGGLMSVSSIECSVISLLHLFLFFDRIHVTSSPSARLQSFRPL